MYFVTGRGVLDGMAALGKFTFPEFWKAAEIQASVSAYSVPS